MKQVIRKGLKNIIVDEVPDPVCGSGQVIVRPFYSLISSGTETADIHTDSIVKEVADNPSHLRTVLNVMKKTDPVATFNEVRAKFSDYAVLGYSGAGVIVEKGRAVTDLSIGDLVAYGGEGTGHGESIAVGRNLIARVPENVDLRHACFTTLGAIAMNAVRLAEIGLGDTVAVIGLGLVGQLTAQLARCHGGVVIAIDLDPQRVDIARQSGADYSLIAGERTVDEVKAITGGIGADRVIVAAASSSPQPLQSGISMARDRGRVVMVGACPIDIPRAEMYIKELSFIVSRAYGPGSYDPQYEKEGVDYPIGYVRWTENRNMEEFLRLVAAGRVNIESLITHEFRLDEAPQAYQTILGGNGTHSLGVVLKYPAADDVDPVATYKPHRKISLAPLPAKKGDVRLALIGAGNLAKWAHLPAIKKLRGAKLAAVVSGSGARGKSYGLRFGAEYATSDETDVLSDESIDAVIIATRHKDHARQIVAALGAGKHVFVEKPMAVTADECREIAAAVRKSGRQLMVGFNRRFAPYYVELRKLLEHRTSPGVVTARMSSPGIQNGWAAEPAQGGVVLGEGCHFVDLMYWLLGSEPLSVSATAFDQHNICAAITFADGSIGNFTYTVTGGESSGGEYVEAFASGVSASTEDFKRLVIKGRERKSRSRFFADKGYDEQIDAFVNSIRAGAETPINVLDGVRATMTCVAMLESAASGMPCRVDLSEFS